MTSKTIQNLSYGLIIGTTIIFSSCGSSKEANAKATEQKVQKQEVKKTNNQVGEELEEM